MRGEFPKVAFLSLHLRLKHVLVVVNFLESWFVRMHLWALQEDYVEKVAR